MGDSGFQQAQCGLPHLPPWAGHHSSQVLFPTEVSHKACNSEIPRTDLFCQRPFQSPENGREGEDRRRGKLPAVFLQDRSFRESLASTLSSHPHFDKINYEHCPGSFDSGDTCQYKIFQKHFYLII